MHYIKLSQCYRLHLLLSLFFCATCQKFLWHDINHKGVIRWLILLLTTMLLIENAIAYNNIIQTHLIMDA